ncbi:MAG: tetratricopeptide repeat protein [Thermoanaerobaculia bacterium]
MALFGRSISRLDELKKSVAKDPTSRQFLALADEYRRAGKLREAAETLESGLRENPGYTAAFVALGRIHQVSQRFDDAIAAFQSALKTDRDNLVAIRQLADCYLKKGEKVEAIKKLKLFRGLQPGDRDVEEIIQQLDAELNAPKPRTGVRVETWPSIQVPRPTVPLREAPPTETPGVRASESSQSDPVAHVPLSSPPPPTQRHSFDPSQPEASQSEFDGSSEGASSASEVASSASEVVELGPEAHEHALDTLVEAEEESPRTEPLPQPPARPLRSAEIFDLTYDGSFRRASPPDDEPGSVRDSAPEPIRRVNRELETAPLPPIAAMVREVEDEAALLESEPESGDIVPALAEFRDASEASVPSDVLRSGDTEEITADVEASAESAVEFSETASETPEAAVTRGSQASPVITETLAELYRTQGYVADARETYQGLAESERDPARAREYRERAAQLPVEPMRSPVARLKGWASHLPSAPTTRIEDLGRVLEDLVESVPGVRAVALIDREGLSLVAAGDELASSSMEVLTAELTAFWKGVHRTRDEVGAGLLSCLTVSGSDGASIVSSVSSEYSLILKVDRAVPLGRVRYEAARAAGILRPALG